MALADDPEVKKCADACIIQQFGSAPIFWRACYSELQRLSSLDHEFNSKPGNQEMD
ncbi:hypothetical protein [Collimonas antrihumi]|uniref:hypothetical protein n=1 Tax=Collimonas antrihumi TaxID=1940615 RepID=UPI001B8C1623|nr:hypothetical protein [Collimonas antrihumi]